MRREREGGIEYLDALSKGRGKTIAGSEFTSSVVDSGGPSGVYGEMLGEGCATVPDLGAGDRQRQVGQLASKIDHRVRSLRLLR